MIQGAEKQDGVLALIRLRQTAGIAHGGRDSGKPPGGGDMLFDRVNHVHGVPALRQPVCLDARAAADVEHRRRWWRQEPRKQLLRTHALQHAVCTKPQPLIFAEVIDVETTHLGVHRLSVPTVRQYTRQWYRRAP